MFPHFKALSNISTEVASVEEHILTCNGYEGGLYTWMVFSVLCFVVGFPASVTVLWHTFRTHRRRSLTPNDFFMLNLSIMDAVFLTFIPAGMLNDYIWGDWFLGNIYQSVCALNTIGRPLLMACVCLDCFVAVVCPVVYHQRRSLLPRVVIVAVVWILTVTSGIVYFFNYLSYFIPFSIVAFAIAIVIIVLCDSFIIRALLKSDPGRRNIHPQKQRAVRTLIHSLVMAVLSYVPPVFLLTIPKQLIDSFQVFVFTVVFPVTITSTLGSAVMPLLSLHNVGELGCFGDPCSSL